MKSLPKNYEHQAREAHWQQHWVEAGTYHYAGDQPRARTFVVDTPPPTVSGILHMGHIFSYTQADFIARYQRMSGKDVFYPMGFDDNGLPTERLVEKTKGIKGSAMPRAQFIEECRSVVLDAENEFRRLFKSAALSVDWRQEYQTINDDVCSLSQASFLDLLKGGNAYRDFRPTYWDWVDQTAIASAEIEEKEMPGVQVVIPFGIMPEADWKAGKRPDFASLEKVHIMTTRPELLGACVALMCNTEDAAQFTGKVAVSPLFNVVVPIQPDDKVTKDKGTGFAMCCSWGDDTDKEWISKYDLPWRPLLDTTGRVNFIEGTGSIAYIAGRNSQKGGWVSELTEANCFDVESALAQLQALKGAKLIRDIKNENSAKGRAIRALEAANLLQPQGDKQELVQAKAQTVKYAERSGTPIEIIPTYQWFVRIVDKKAELLEKGAKVQWHPDYMRIRLNQWIEGLKEDWCISRQRFFGIPFPVWYSKRAGEEGKILFADYDQLPIDPQIGLPKGYTRDEVQADIDVLDTWATSSISPQLNSRGINSNFMVDEARHKALFPADLRPQAHEIIRTWAFYTIAKAHLHENTIPWHNIMISGWCLAADKTKMSKSKGNVVTPVALIEEKGTDSVRYWASTSRLGADTAFSEDLLKIGKKLVGKLWNASQFVAINFEKLDGKPTTATQDVASGRITEALDLWALTRLHHAVAKATIAFEQFEYCDARVAIEDFFWNDFCDNYLELVKARAYGEGIAPAQQQSALYALYHCLEAILRLFAPFVPHITEELYSHLFDDRYDAKGSVHARGMWPAAGDYPVCEASERAGMAAVDVLNVIRKAKSEANVSIKYPVAEVLVASLNAGASWADLTRVLADVKAAGNAAHINESQDLDQPLRTERGWFAVRVTLLPVEEHKLDEQQAAKGTTTPRNPDQAAHEKLEPEKMLHGVGSPDLSKHTVKVQVNRLPDSLQRQK